MKKNFLHIIRNTSNNRLAEMGFIKGTIIRVIKKVSGMIQIRINDSDVVIREETQKDIDTEKYNG